MQTTSRLAKDKIWGKGVKAVLPREGFYTAHMALQSAIKNEIDSKVLIFSFFMKEIFLCLIFIFITSQEKLPKAS